MKISVMTFAYHGMLSRDKASIDLFLERITSAGAVGVEPMLEWKNKEPEAWQYFFQATQAKGLKMAAYDIGINLVTGNAEEFRQTKEQAQAQIAYCRETLNSSVVLFYYNRPLPGMTLPEARKRYGEMLNVLSVFAEQYDVNVCFENFDPLPHFVCSSEACLETLSYAPKAGFSLDIGNCLIADENGLDVLPRLMGRIQHLHAKEKRQVDSSVANAQHSIAGNCYVDAILGDGNANVAGCIKYAREHGYDKWISIESFMGFDNVHLDIAYLKNLIVTIQKGVFCPAGASAEGASRDERSEERG